jgi:hypothetical protein
MKTNYSMNTVMKKILCLSMTALLITTAAAGPGLGSGKKSHFEGSIDGVESFDFDSSPGELIIEGVADVKGKHLSGFFSTWTFTIDLGNPEGGGVGIRTFIAPNGDEIWSMGEGAGTPPDPDQFVVTHYMITGGTGKYSGATGSYTVERDVFNVAPPFIDLETTGRFDGTIILGHSFRGSLDGSESFDFGSSPGELIINGSAEVEGKHLRAFTSTWTFTIDLAAPEGGGVGTRTFIAPNGDEIWSEGEGAGTPPDPDQFVVTHYMITGGTGKYTGATGSYTVERDVFNVAPPFIDLETTGTFDGAIFLARKHHHQHKL